MKPNQLLGAVALFVLSCNNNADEKAPLSMSGAYSMTSITMKNAEMDTTSTSQNQMKIYTSDHLIYAWVNPADSTAGFGVGSYEASADGVSEHIFFTSGDSTSSDSLRTYAVNITKDESGGYTQVIDSLGTPGNMINLTEVYQSTGTNATSPLDGIWKLTTVYWIDSKGDTTKMGRTQYKVYNAGNVIWGNSYQDSTGITRSLVGYGSFTMSGDTLVKESMKQSNISAVRGNSFDLAIEITGADGFKQTISDTGGKTVEVYERVKK